MVVVHLVASPFFGGPERQMLGLAASLPGDCRTVFLSFAEGGRCRPFLDEARRLGFEAVELERNAPHYRAAVCEVAGHLRRTRADVLCCHGYKPDLLGWPAARRVGLPVVAVARGWTAATLKVRLNEALDRLCLRTMDRVVCVSEGQAARIRRAGVPAARVAVIRNAIRAERFDRPDPADRDRLLGLFPGRPGRVVGAAGRLSPEKGFGVLVAAAGSVARADPGVAFVLFGEGPLRADLARRIAAEGLDGRFLLAGFRDDLDRLLPHLDLFVLPSFTEGLPNVVLEAFAAGVPVVATAVGGTPEVVEEGLSGHLVPPGDPAALARHIRGLLGDGGRRRAMGRHGRARVRDQFTFEAQGLQYRRLFEELTGRRAAGS
jgi:glycosyltransferase involved in cell wall biosynthesis